MAGNATKPSDGKQTAEETTSELSPREAELLRKLEAAEKAAMDAEQQLAEHIASDSSGLRVRQEAGGPYRGEQNGWQFRIGPVSPEKYPHLRIIEERACDESELIRWYCATNQDPPKSGRQVDPVKVKLKVECLDPGRAKLRLFQQQLANIRNKLNTGTQLTKAEQDLLEKHEDKILGY